MISSAAMRALIVNSPKDGGVSKITKSRCKLLSAFFNMLSRPRTCANSRSALARLISQGRMSSFSLTGAITSRARFSPIKTSYRLASGS